MFTGIVTDIGTVETITPLNEGIRLRVSSGYDPATISIGASISHAGVCLTVTALPEAGSNERWHEVEAWEEALRLTTAGDWGEGSRINLERALKVGDDLGRRIHMARHDMSAEFVAHLQRALQIDGGAGLTVLDIPPAQLGPVYDRRLVLARPDQIIAWRGDALPDDPAALVALIRGA
eukprot:gene34302-46011_t